MTAGEHRHDSEARADVEASTTRHEERTIIGTEVHDAGSVRVRRHVSTYPIEEVVDRSVEHAEISDRVVAGEGDSGEVETLPDGSVSIPVFEEVLVVTKKLVVRERVIVRKHTVVDEHTIRTELRREHVTVDADRVIQDRIVERTQDRTPEQRPESRNADPTAS